MNTFTLGACFQHELHTGPYFMTFAPTLLVRSKTYKYLGIDLDENLTWDSHIAKSIRWPRGYPTCQKLDSSCDSYYDFKSSRPTLL